MIKKLKIFTHSLILWSFGFSVFAQEEGYEGIPLTVQSVFGIITGLACWFTRFALVLMVVMIVFYGVKFMIAQGDPTKLTEAKKSFNWALIGILVILGTYTIIATIGTFLSGVPYQVLPLDCSAY